MSSVLFDSGDLQRLDRERTLTEQAPRALPEDDRSPAEDPLDVLTVRDEFNPESENDVDILLDALALVLKRRLE